MLSVIIVRRVKMALTNATGYYILLFAPLLRVSANLSSFDCSLLSQISICFIKLVVQRDSSLRNDGIGSGFLWSGRRTHGY